MILDQLFENTEPGAMAQAVTRRILSTRSDLLSRYGVEAVSQAIDDVTQGDDWEEIGSSDVSAYVRYVEDYLRDHHGSGEEMADRKPFAEQGVSENQRRFNNVNDDDLYAVDPRTKEIIAHLGNPYNDRNAVLIKKRQHEQQGHLVMSGMRAKFYRDVNEQQIQEDRVVPVVVIGPNNQKISRSVRLSPTTKDPVRDIMRYYARLGMELYSVAGQRVGAGAVSEGPAVDAYMSGKSPAIAHWADQLDRIAAKNESRTICPECGGAAYQSRLLAEKKDACYHKVRSRYKVWPSAYASGALVQCRKKGADNWGTGGGKK